MNLSGLKGIVKLYLSHNVYVILLSGPFPILLLTHHHSIASFLKVKKIIYLF